MALSCGAVLTSRDGSTTEMVEISAEIMVCTDCVTLIANGEGPEEKAQALADKWGVMNLALSDDMYDEPEHSNRDCEGCGDPFAGDRFPAVVLV